MDHKTKGSSQGLLRSPTSPEPPTFPSISAEGKTRVDKLLEQIDSIVPSDTTDSSGVQESHQRWLIEACIDGDTLKYGVERMHHYWLSSASAVTKAAMFLCSNYMFEVDGLKLRQDLLTCLQKDFESRLEIQAKSPEKFLNAAAFLIEMFIRIRIEKLPLSFMANPVFQYLEDLLDGDDSEFKLFAHLVVSVAPTLQETQMGENNDASLASDVLLQKLFSKVRSTLMSRNLSCQSRLWLLFVVDISSSGKFSLPSRSLQEFYRSKDQLGSTVDTTIKLLNNFPSISKQANEIQDGSRLMPETVVRDKVSQIKISPKSDELASAGKSTSFGPKRNPGRNGAVDKRENFRSILVEPKSNKGMGYWLHDDRFDKEDTTSKERNAGNLPKPRASQGNWKHSATPKEKDGRSRVSDNWRQPQSNRPQRDYRESTEPKVTDLLAGHELEENWEETEDDKKPKEVSSNWRQQSQQPPQQPPQQPQANNSWTKPVDLLAGHQLEENWDE